MARTHTRDRAPLAHRQMALPGMIDTDPLRHYVTSESRLASHRKPWWYLGPVAAPAIVASYMARQAPAFAYNPDGLALLNIAHGLYPRRPLSAAQLVSLVRELNAARHTFSGHGRTYQGGLEKFEPREMEELAVHIDLDGRRAS